jgi:hypothetical protein
MTDNDKAPRSRFPEAAALIEANPALPDPFEFFDPRLGRDGRVETRADWEARREEIKDLAMYYFFGYRQPTPREASRLKIRTVEVPESVVIDRRRAMAPGTFSVSLPEGSYKWNFLGFTLLPVLDYRDGEWGSWEEHSDMLMTIPAHTRRDAYVSVADKGGTAEIRLDALEIPVKGLDTELDGPYPALIVIGGLPPEQVKTLKARGYAYIAMNTGSVYGDGAARGGAYTELYPYKEGIYEYDSGALMGWAWGVSRIVDALLNDPSFNIDGSRTAVTGVSRNGKAALLAAAFDERISAAFPCDSARPGSRASGFLTRAGSTATTSTESTARLSEFFRAMKSPSTPSAVSATGSAPKRGTLFPTEPNASPSTCTRSPLSSPPGRFWPLPARTSNG